MYNIIGYAGSNFVHGFFYLKILYKYEKFIFKSR